MNLLQALKNSASVLYVQRVHKFGVHEVGVDLFCKTSVCDADPFRKAFGMRKLIPQLFIYIGKEIIYFKAAVFCTNK